MLRITILIVFGIFSYCQGHPYSRADHAINSNMEPVSIEEYQGEEWIAENEGRAGGANPIAMRPDNNGGYAQTWEPHVHQYNEDNPAMAAAEDCDPTAHAEAPPVTISPIPNDTPYSAVVYLSNAQCTGTFIAPKTILTAAHCVIDEKTKKMVLPGIMQRQKGCSDDGVAQYTVNGIVPHPEYKEWEYDYAIILTKEASPVWLGYADDSYKNMPLVVYGYPGDDPKKCMWESTCQLFRHGAIFLRYPCELKLGMSGGPIYDPINKVVVGIHTTGDDGKLPKLQNDFGIRITGTVRGIISDWINQYHGN